VKITTLNLNGLRSADRRGLRAWLKKRKPDVLLMQEIRVDAESAPPDLWKPRGWSVAWNPAQKKGYAGTAAWARGKGEFSVGTGHARGDAEGRVVGASIEGLDCYSVYLPSGSSGPHRQAWKMEYLDHVLPWMERLIASGRPVIVGGDFNIAHTAMDIKNARGNAKNSGFLPEERAWLDRLVAMGWRDLFRECNPESQAYSWWSQRGAAYAKDVGWRIDQLWATPGVRCSKVEIERGALLSDHAPVTAWVGE
jgi:exodeoxyribonuclease-3